MNREQRRQAWAAMSAGRDDLDPAAVDTDPEGLESYGFGYGYPPDMPLSPVRHAVTNDSVLYHPNGLPRFGPYDSLGSVQHRLEDQPPLWERALDTGAALALVTAVGVLGALAGHRSASWTSEDGEDA